MLEYVYHRMGVQRSGLVSISHVWRGKGLRCIKKDAGLFIETLHMYIYVHMLALVRDSGMTEGPGETPQ